MERLLHFLPFSEAHSSLVDVNGGVFYTAFALSAYRRSVLFYVRSVSSRLILLLLVDVINGIFSSILSIGVATEQAAHVSTTAHNSVSKMVTRILHCSLLALLPDFLPVPSSNATFFTMAGGTTMLVSTIMSSPCSCINRYFLGSGASRLIGVVLLYGILFLGDDSWRATANTSFSTSES
ncbi:hypothetical protein AX774_g5565 [Zancudomyces culisetae]|uniref:Uncharacterized protein n=1 Tax=Zancudomyces culisetae TaxID=1213189 RepID=A0A1R1PD75_ZANCU|nr:hypothetical protein AX774_g7731 [Zancudomyces culisetae]OMH80987.1 hypothetical protein AX774_g5565 [Zancudomyces culisetae]|eukprot:OMH78869.1 hypothetical protein AX774_g7731 [Zancudomyces culisetae]